MPRALVVMAIVAVLVSVRGDVFSLNSAQAAASAHSYDLIGWHLTNFMSKWVHQVVRALPGQGIDDSERLALVDEYFQLGSTVNELNRDINAVAARDGDIAATVISLESELEGVRDRRLALRNDVEEAIESEVSSAARSQGLGIVGEFIFPPVDVRLTEPPKVLVTSPRDRIERLNDALVDSDIEIDDREQVEQELLDEENLSAIVLDIGGVATYPASIRNGGDLRGTLQITAHEWLHHYLFFRPLGQNLYNSPEMQVLNETVADLAGRELGDMAFESIQSRMPTKVPIGLGVPEDSGTDIVDVIADFDFRAEMQQTRQVADQMLSEGRIEEAEAYMELRRKIFVANGFAIRKINQAFFAFTGTYGESAASVSPIGGQVRRLRELSDDVGEFLSRVSGVSSYEEFLSLLDGIEGSEQTG